MPVKIRDSAVAYKGWLTIHKATLAGDDGVEFSREIEDHGAGVAVLPYDPERRVALLVELPRAPVLMGGGTLNLIEVPAGLRAPGEDPADAARREAREETGVVLDGLDHVGSLWSMPGISTERMDIYLAPYRAADRTGLGGGLAEEHENITVLEMPLAALSALADRNALLDTKTLVLVQTLRLRRPELFQSMMPRGGGTGP